jgi:N-acetylmuramoyl-L-alanine amidase
MPTVCVIVDKGHHVKPGGSTTGTEGVYWRPDPDTPGGFKRVTLTEYDAITDIATAFKAALEKRFAFVDETPRCENLAQRLKEKVEARFKNVETRGLVVALVSVHLNSGGGTGTEVFYSKESVKKNTRSKDLADVLCKQVVKCAERFADKLEPPYVDGRWKNRGTKTEADVPGREWALRLIQWQGVPRTDREGNVIRWSGAAKEAGITKEFYENCLCAVLVEVGFMDSAHDMKVIGQPLFRQQVGEVMAEGVAIWAKALP